MIFKKIKRIKNTGFSIIEMIFYISLFAILTVVIVNLMMTMTKSFKEVSVRREITQGAEIMERISREIKQAKQINNIVDANGDLRLNTTDDAGADKIIEFVLTNSNIRLLENNSYTGDINSPNIVVDSLRFDQVTTTKGQAVKIVLTIKSKHDTKNRTYKYYNTVVLRGNY